MKTWAVAAAIASLLTLPVVGHSKALCGKAAWYQLTSKTASGEPGNPNGMTAAHRTLPFGTLINVTNLRNNRTVTVRVNDRGPFTKNRVLDLTRAAAQRLDYIRNGWAPVRIEIVDDPSASDASACRPK